MWGEDAAALLNSLIYTVCVLLLFPYRNKIELLLYTIIFVVLFAILLILVY